MTSPPRSSPSSTCSAPISRSPRRRASRSESSSAFLASGVNRVRRPRRAAALERARAERRLRAAADLVEVDAQRGERLGVHRAAAAARSASGVAPWRASTSRARPGVTAMPISSCSAPTWPSRLGVRGRHGLRGRPWRTARTSVLPPAEPAPAAVLLVDRLLADAQRRPRSAATTTRARGRSRPAATRATRAARAAPPRRAARRLGRGSPWRPPAPWPGSCRQLTLTKPSSSTLVDEGGARYRPAPP